MFLINKLSATFGIGVTAAASIAGVIFWAALCGAKSSEIKAAVFASCGFIVAGLIMAAISVGCWYLVNRFSYKTKLANW